MRNGREKEARGRGEEARTVVASSSAAFSLAAALRAVHRAAAPGVSTHDLDQVAEAVIRDGGGIPSFKGYHGFPASICSSVNDRVVHGIPSATETLAAGDLVSIDCGAILDGWHGDVILREVRQDDGMEATRSDDAPTKLKAIGPRTTFQTEALVLEPTPCGLGGARLGSLLGREKYRHRYSNT